MRRRSIQDRLGTVPGAWPTDARRVDDRPSRTEAPDPEASRRRRRARRVSFLVLAIVFLITMSSAVFGRGGLLEYVRLEAERARLEADIAAARARVDALRSEVDALEHGGPARERVARERLGYAREGELVFVLPPESPSP